MTKLALSTCTETKPQRKKDVLALSPNEIRTLYLVREKYMERIVDLAVGLDEGHRRLALDLLETMCEHRRSKLS